jgi:N-acetylglucosaminyldiphosphoundecaprenol N-acetyl-beta-D-mannosaminyltransferase
VLEKGKGNIIGILIDAVDYKVAVDRIVQAARGRRPMATSALAVHGLMTGILDSEYKYRLNRFDLLVPDGQPVRWALNLLHGAHLRDRVYGPNLMLAVCSRAEEEGMGVFLFGSTQEILFKLRTNLENRFPGLRITGMEPSKFRRLSADERTDLITRVRRSRADIIFVGLGCPRQEIWTYELREVLSMPILAVGAAFPFLAGKIPQAPKWMQDRGLEWLFRLFVEPRLWRRYVLLNPAYALLVAFQATGLSRFKTNGNPPCEESSYG